MKKAVKYNFLVLAPINFYFNGRWYRKNAGDILTEDAQRGQQLIDGNRTEFLRLVGKDEVEVEDESQPASQQEAPLSEEEEASEADQTEESSQSEPEEAQEESVLEQEKEAAPLLEEFEQGTSEEAKPFPFEEDAHWSKIAAALDGVLEADPIDWDMAERIYNKYSNYKAVRESYEAAVTNKDV